MSYSVKSTWNDGWDLALRTVGCYYKCPSVPDSVSDGRKTEAMWSQQQRAEFLSRRWQAGLRGE